MSAEAILKAIEASGAAELARVQAEAAGRVRQILAQAEAEAAARQAEGCEQVVAPAAAGRAHRLQQAHLIARQTAASAFDDWIEEALALTGRRLAGLRAEPIYQQILPALVREAIEALGETERARGPVGLSADPRDAELLAMIMRQPGLAAQVQYDLESWGGVIARSGDGRVTVYNTLEKRLEQATPYLRQALAAFLETQPATAAGDEEATAREVCPTLTTATPA
jgi:vacuolar-type H+-ATPase subunit E/Vma4